MNTAGACLSSLAQVLWAVSWQAALLAGLIWLVSLFCRRATPAFRYWLWCVVLVRLCLPLSLTLPVGIIRTAEGPAGPATSVQAMGTAEEKTSLAGEVPPANHAPAFFETPSAPVPAAPSAKFTNPFSRIPLGNWLGLGWLGVVAGLGLALLIQILRTRRRVKALAPPARPELWALFRHLKEELKIHGRVELRCADAVLGQAGPMTIGAIRPTIILPRAMAENWALGEIEPVLIHELAHVRRGDLLVNWLQILVQAVYFFHPLVWFVNWRIRQEREWACDDVAVQQIGGRPGAYGRSILRMLEESTGSFSLATAALGMAERRNSLSRRIVRIMDRNYESARRMGKYSVVLLIALGAFCIALASEQGPMNKKPAPVKESKPVPAKDAVAAKDAAPAKDAAAAKVQDVKAAPAMAAPAAATEDEEKIDPKIMELGKATHKRITTYSDSTTFTLANNASVEMALKPNAAKVAKLRVTVKIVEQGTNFDLEALGADGKSMNAMPSKLGPVVDDDDWRTGVAVRGALDQLFKIQVIPRRIGGDQVRVNVSVLVTKAPTTEEIQAMLLSQGKEGCMMMDFGKIRMQIMEYKRENGKYPERLDQLEGIPLKDAYSRKGEPYHYEPKPNGYLLSSCGKDGIWGNDDDTVEIEVGKGNGVITGNRKTLILPKEIMAPMADDDVTSQKETLGPTGRRPKGDCSISGRVVSDKIGKPIRSGTVYLHYTTTLDAIFIEPAADGSFEFKDIPAGQYSLSVIHAPGYQDFHYNPSNLPGDYPQFTLQPKEQRRGVELALKPAFRILGKVVDENGKTPLEAGVLTVIAWGINKEKGRDPYHIVAQKNINPEDGSYTLDGLDGSPVYVAVQDFSAQEKENPLPVIYAPGTVSRDAARRIDFSNSPVVKDADIRLVRKGGQVLEGSVTAADTGKPVAKALVVVHHQDMLFDRVAAYTDDQGHYKLESLGPGAYRVHVDATPQNLVRTRKEFTVEPGKPVRLDFSLNPGATISGRIADEKGNDLPMVMHNTFGYARVKGVVLPNQSYSGVPNKHAPKTVGSGGSCTYFPGEGDYDQNGMTFPTASTFTVQGMKPGEIVLDFLPYTAGKKVLMVLHNNQDALESGIAAKAGEKIEDVVIVVGANDGKAK